MIRPGRSLQHWQSLAGLTLMLLLGVSPAKAQDNVAAFETQLDFTIRSACHGYMVDAIPDFLDQARSWLNKNTPFCQTVRTLGKDDSAYELLKQQNPTTDYQNDPEYSIKYLSGYNPELHRHNDCNDWMCEHVRDNAHDKGYPLSLADYKKVEQHCDGAYGCIESWFKTWPRPLPEPTNTVQLSLDDLLAAQDSQPPQTNPSTPKQHAESGMNLDALMGATKSTPSTQPTKNASITMGKAPQSLGGAELSLNNVFAGREQLALDKSLQRIRSYHGKLQNQCQCSLENSGCYQLPDRSLIEQANQQEQSRYESCTHWQAQQSLTPSTAKAANQQLAQLTSLEKAINTFDNEMESAIQRWEKQRREAIAQQKREAQERADSAYLAGMASIIMQSGQVANGNISAEQAARNAVNVSRGIENGQSWGDSMSRHLTSSIPHYNPSGLASHNSTHDSSQQPGASPPTQAKPAEYYAICKHRRGTATTAGCIGVRVEGVGNGCSGNTCAQNLRDLCQAIGTQIGAPFDEYASGLGSFDSPSQCIARCENNYGVKNWGKYGSKCLGMVSQ